MLHGWGANYHDLVGLSSYIDQPDYQFFFPNAPFPHPYAPGGRMWYGFPEDFAFHAESDLAEQGDREEGKQLAESRRLLTAWLHSLEATTDIPLSRTVLGGFSQGGAMTLDVGSQLPLAALLVMSGYLHGPLASVDHPLPPTLLVHGRQDPVVPLAAARQTHDRLTRLHTPVTYQEFEMGHEIPADVLDAMQSFLSEIALA